MAPVCENFFLLIKSFFIVNDYFYFGPKLLLKFNYGWMKKSSKVIKNNIFKWTSKLVTFLHTYRHLLSLQIHWSIPWVQFSSFWTFVDVQFSSSISIKVQNNIIFEHDYFNFWIRRMQKSIKTMWKQNITSKHSHISVHHIRSRQFWLLQAPFKSPQRISFFIPRQLITGKRASDNSEHVSRIIQQNID